MNKPLILVVEDDAPIRNLITTTLKTQDYKYIAAATASEALQQATYSQLVCDAHHRYQCPQRRQR